MGCNYFITKGILGFRIFNALFFVVKILQIVRASFSVSNETSLKISKSCARLNKHNDIYP